ncbi:MAG TPA: hypothetical protein VMT34_13135 [Aggregatilineales bacterium]|nr:hypothetical protein [Aggregatilineales bacterium]
MSDNTQGTAAKAQEYQRAVEEFEKLDKQVDALLSSRGGHTNELSDEDYTHYRELAELRDLAYNQMKTLERGLLDES